MSQRNVEVAVGLSSGQEDVIHVIPERGIVTLPDTNVEFDFAFTQDQDQELVYNITTANLIENLFQGFNTTVTAYGPTNTGKTFTIFGYSLGNDRGWSHTGLVAFSLRDIYDRFEKLLPKRNISLCVSYYEINNDEIHDLLTPDPSCNAFLDTDETGSVIVSGLTEIDCISMDQVLCCLDRGLKLRSQFQSMTSFGSNLTKHSHMVLTIVVKQRWIEGDAYIESTSRMSFVDLAGSERFGSNVDGGYNSGLLALNNVITALGDPRRKAHHVPYWDSRLTSVLKNALGGDSLTLFICCLSPRFENIEETLDTLHIGVCARNISNTVINHTVVRPVYEAYESQRSTLMHQGFRPVNPYLNADRFFIPITPVPEESLTYSVISNEYRQSIRAEGEERVTAPQNGCQLNFGNKLEINHGSSLQDQLFKLQFAVSQMMVLIKSAQDLLNDLSMDDLCSREYRNRAEAWLCLKQECEECLAPDLGYGSGSIDRLSISDEIEAKSLDVIEEVSEPTGTHSTETTHYRQDDAEANIEERLKVIRSQFRWTTNKLLRNMEDSKCVLLHVIRRNRFGSTDNEGSEPSDDEVETTLQVHRTVPPPRRRQSIFQGMVGQMSEASDPAFVLQQLKERLGEDLEGSISNHSGSKSIDPELISKRRVSRSTSPISIGEMNSNQLPTTSLAASEPLPSTNFSQCGLKQRTLSERRRSSSESGSDEEIRGRVVESQLRQEVRELSASTESKKLKVKQTNWDMKAVKRMLKELRSTIEIKEALLFDLEKAEEQSDIAQKKFERRIERLEQHIAEYKERAEKEQQKLKLWEELEKGSEGEEETVEEVEKKVKKLLQKIQEDQKRLADLQNLRSLTERDPGRIEDLRRSVSVLKEKEEDLHSQFEIEGEKKKKLELELLNENKKIRELSKMLEAQQSINEVFRLRGSRVPGNTLETPSPFRSVTESDGGRNSVFSGTNQLSNSLSKEDPDRNKAISILTQDKKECEKSSHMSLTKSVQTDNGDSERVGQDELRYEIRKLRKARDSLMVCKQQLDEVRHLDGQLDSLEERRWIEYDEAIEAVDWAIEHKNQLICNAEMQENTLEDLTCDESLLARLNRLSIGEIRKLFTKYFRKVVELREGCRKLEQQVVELEDRLKQQITDYRKVHDKVQRVRFDAECQLVAQQRDYEQQISALIRQLGEDSSGSSATERRLRHMESEVEHLRKENRMLKVNLSDMMLRVGAGKEQHKQENSSILPEPSTSTYRGPFSLLPVLHGFRNKPAKNTITTQVTRQKNKLIIEEKIKNQRKNEKK
ncbi:kinesin-like protein kif7 isoform X2 [Artemia franciscana]|uniref:kinesin-like protein kif7 isoform X2 n=1 Tax=Artemia franciscana TaxID=6661 RepID=UPI0032DA6042